MILRNLIKTPTGQRPVFNGMRIPLKKPRLPTDIGTPTSNVRNLSIRTSKKPELKESLKQLIQFILKTFICPPITIKLAPSTRSSINSLAKKYKPYTFPKKNRINYQDALIEYSDSLAELFDEFASAALRENMAYDRKLWAMDDRIEEDMALSELPVSKKYKELMDLIEKNQIVIVSAATGSGKSTQIPNFILKAHQSSPSASPPPYIIVTQPRRMAAISLANRVARERGEQLGESVGYKVRFENNDVYSENGKICIYNNKKMQYVNAFFNTVFVTPGILLKMVVHDTNITHLILDEIHERDQTTELLLLVVKQVISIRPNLKIILMSATLDVDALQKFLTTKTDESIKEDSAINSVVKHSPTPVSISIPGTLHPITVTHIQSIFPQLPAKELLGDLATRVFLKYHNIRDVPENVSLSNPPFPIPDRFMRTHIPLLLIEKTILNIIQRNRTPSTILVFLPGLHEIMRLLESMERLPDIQILPLYAYLSNSEVAEILDDSVKGNWKVILATSVAESSITIPSVVHVVDSGASRLSYYNCAINEHSLMTIYEGVSNMTQRIGRAGRSQPGHYYSILPYQESTKDNSLACLPTILKPQLSSELTRIQLATPILSLLTAITSIESIKTNKSNYLFPEEQYASVHDIYKLFGDSLHEPPSKEQIDHGIEELVRTGAVEKSDKEGSILLTPLGCIMRDFPLDPAIAKLVLRGAIFKCIDPILTIASSFNEHELFKRSPSSSSKPQASPAAGIKKSIFGYSIHNPNTPHGSDYLAIVQAYNFIQANSYKAGAIGLKTFCEQYYINHLAIQQMEKIRIQLFESLCRIGLVDKAIDQHNSDYGFLGGRRLNENSDNEELIKNLVGAALYPNIAVRDVNNPKLFRHRMNAPGLGVADMSVYHEDPDEQLAEEQESVDSSGKSVVDEEKQIVVDKLQSFITEELEAKDNFFTPVEKNYASSDIYCFHRITAVSDNPANSLMSNVTKINPIACLFFSPVDTAAGPSIFRNNRNSDVHVLLNSCIPLHFENRRDLNNILSLKRMYMDYESLLFYKLYNEQCDWSSSREVKSTNIERWKKSDVFQEELKSLILSTLF